MRTLLSVRKVETGVPGRRHPTHDPLHSLLDTRRSALHTPQLMIQRRTMDQLQTAIVENDLRAVADLLEADAGLATCLITSRKLYRENILHWIYSRDTALHLAAAGHRVEIVRLLLTAGADPNATQNHRESSPLHYAADGCVGSSVWNNENQVDTIQALINRGARIDLQDKNGATALHRAVRTRCAGAVRYLLKAGSDPKIKNKPGSTPFHLAVQNTGRGGSGHDAAINGQREIILEFLSRGLSPNLKCSRGKSVRDWAKSTWIRDLLVQPNRKP